MNDLEGAVLGLIVGLLEMGLSLWLLVELTSNTCF
jgi:hypothetical protein